MIDHICIFQVVVQLRETPVIKAGSGGTQGFGGCGLVASTEWCVGNAAHIIPGNGKKDSPSYVKYITL